MSKNQPWELQSLIPMLKDPRTPPAPKKSWQERSGPRYRPPASNCSWSENSASLSRCLTAGTASWALSGRSLPPPRTEISRILPGETRPNPAPARTSWHSSILHFSSCSPASVHELLPLRKIRSSISGTELTLLPAPVGPLVSILYQLLCLWGSLLLQNQNDTWLTREASCSQLSHVEKSWLQPSSLPDRLPCVLPAAEL